MQRQRHPEGPEISVTHRERATLAAERHAEESRTRLPRAGETAKSAGHAGLTRSSLKDAGPRTKRRTPRAALRKIQHLQPCAAKASRSRNTTDGGNADDGRQRRQEPRVKRTVAIAVTDHSEKRSRPRRAGNTDAAEQPHSARAPAVSPPSPANLDRDPTPSRRLATQEHDRTHRLRRRPWECSDRAKARPRRPDHRANSCAVSPDRRGRSNASKRTRRRRSSRCGSCARPRPPETSSEGCPRSPPRGTATPRRPRRRPPGQPRSCHLQSYPSRRSHPPNRRRPEPACWRASCRGRWPRGRTCTLGDRADGRVRATAGVWAAALRERKVQHKHRTQPSTKVGATTRSGPFLAEVLLRARREYCRAFPLYIVTAALQL